MAGLVALPRLRWPGSWLPVGGRGEAPVSLHGCAAIVLFGLDLKVLILSNPGLLHGAPLCIDPLPCSASTLLKVHLYW